jgi:predicted dienelactone hydrolase
LALAVAINHETRSPDEWFDEPDDLDRVATALATIDESTIP